MHNYKALRKSDHKHKRTKLSSAEWSKLRKQVWKEQHGRCAECGYWIRLDGDTVFNTAHLAHIKSKGSGGDDSRENVRILCPFCHLQKEHGPHWSNKRGENNENLL